MSLQAIPVFGFSAGVQKNKKPFLLEDDAFVELENAYVYREELRKREGLRLIGRFRRVLTVVSLGNSAASDTQTFNIFTVAGITGENGMIEPSTVTITIANGPDIVFTEAGDGIFAVGGSVDTGSYINYATGDVVLKTTAPVGVVAMTADFNYYPGLPAMGIWVREIPGINNEQTIWFDQKYAYIHDGTNFQEFLPTPATTWNGTDSDFFWCTNYRGADAQERLFFATNFFINAGSPMRYTDGTTWTTFNPIVSGTTQTDILTTTLPFGSANFGPANLTVVPIIKGTLVITVALAGQNDVVFRDTPKDGTLVSSPSNTGTIDYLTGAVNLTFNPVLPGAGNWSVTAVYSIPENYLFGARILIPYYGRLLALNTFEGTTVGAASSNNTFNRCRFSQVGSPIQQDAWRADTFGKGGFVDAPVNEDIIGATFYKNTLIVTFERSTWRLQYIGEYGIPFIWERISSDFGSESTFSSVLFDSGVLSVGDKAIVGSSGNDVQRIDLDIPDTVYEFKNANEGVKRVHGIRDFRHELVYWSYNDFDQSLGGQYYPNYSLLYNYRNNTFAKFRNNVTCFGNFQYPSGILWDRLDVFWWDESVLWDSSEQENYPMIACANQQGFAHFYGFPSAKIAINSVVPLADQESLAVLGVTVTATEVTLNIVNHNLLEGEFIYLAGLIYATTATSTAGSSSLNSQIYSVKYVDVDNVTLNIFDQASGKMAVLTSAGVTNVGDYLGGGLVALLPRINIRTKDFSPAKQAGMNVKTSYFDFLFDATTNSDISVQVKINTGDAFTGNLEIGNKSVEMANRKFGNISNAEKTNPCLITSKDHGLLDGAKVLFQNVQGMVEINGPQYTITFVTTDTFSLDGIDATGAGYTQYTRRGNWYEETSDFWLLSAKYGWHRFFATCHGQMFALLLSNTDEQMSHIPTHTQNFVLNAMQLYFRPGGKNIFGR